MRKKYFSFNVLQVAKNNGLVCGDYFVCDRTAEATIVVVCDGLGSGVKANLAAVMCAGRLLELMRQGFSLLNSVESVVKTMHQARTEDIPFSAFIVAYILNDGQTRIFVYEMPLPIVVSQGAACVLSPRFLTLAHEVVAEINIKLNMGDGLLLLSDGISQAGMGREYRLGLGVEGVAQMINLFESKELSLNAMVDKIFSRAKELSGAGYGDDMTLASIECQVAQQLTVLTGPPADKFLDVKVTDRFKKMPGRKIVCGSTTADIVARALSVTVQLQNQTSSPFIPPSYFIEGIDLVTEGAITLNQAYNIIQEDLDKFEADSSVEQLCLFLRTANQIHFIVGTASNPQHQTFLFRQVGILPRQAVVQLLADKLKLLGKRVTIEYV